jgi:hypothetical protein
MNTTVSKEPPRWPSREKDAPLMKNTLLDGLYMKNMLRANGLARRTADYLKFMKSAHLP